MSRYHMTITKYDAKQGVGYTLDGSEDQPRDEKGRWADTEGRVPSPEIESTKSNFAEARMSLPGITKPVLEFGEYVHERVVNKEIVKGPGGKDMFARGLTAKLRDYKTREVVEREVTGHTDTPTAAKILKEMHKELKGRVAEVKARKSSWASVNRS